MEITEAQYARIAPYPPVQRGNVSLSNLQVLNAILYVAEHGCKWRGLPPRFGNWHTVYMRMNRWSKNGVLDRVFDPREVPPAQPSPSALPKTSVACCSSAFLRQTVEYTLTTCPIFRGHLSSLVHKMCRS